MCAPNEENEKEPPFYKSSSCYLQDWKEALQHIFVAFGQVQWGPAIKHYTLKHT